jgi:hypothetical protein
MESIYCHKCGTKNTGVKFCTNCGTALLTDVNEDGVPEYVQETVQLECPWCKTFNKVIHETNCKNCGGPLPAIPHGDSGLDAGKPPGPPPRKIPAVYVKKLKYKNVHFLIGIIFLVPFIWTIIFPIIGFFLLRHGLKVANKKLEALEKGVKTEGILTDIYKDTSQSVNGRHPWKIEYEFKTRNGELISAKKTGAWNSNNRYRKPNDKLWVVYLTEDPSVSAIWPPVD